MTTPPNTPWKSLGNAANGGRPQTAHEYGGRQSFNGVGHKTAELSSRGQKNWKPAWQGRFFCNNSRDGTGEELGINHSALMSSLPWPAASTWYRLAQAWKRSWSPEAGATRQQEGDSGEAAERKHRSVAVYRAHTAPPQISLFSHWKATQPHLSPRFQIWLILYIKGA